MPAIGENGIIKPGLYVVRLKNKAYASFDPQCWIRWADAQPEVEIVTDVWEPPGRIGIDFADEQALRVAQAAANASAGPFGAEKHTFDGDTYIGFVVGKNAPTKFWDFGTSCPVAAWPWDGEQDLELASTGPGIKPYTEIDAAADAAKQTAEKAAEVAKEAPQAIVDAAEKANEVVGKITPWWVKVGAGFLAAVGVGYAANALGAFKGK